MRVGSEKRAALTLTVDGDVIQACAGDTLAGAMLADGRFVFRTDTRGRARGLFCNMGTCCECLVTLADNRRVRACLTPALDGMTVRTRD